jgi:hypothetical protein
MKALALLVASVGVLALCLEIFLESEKTENAPLWLAYVNGPYVGKKRNKWKGWEKLWQNGKNLKG